MNEFYLGLLAGIAAFFFKDMWTARARRRQRLLDASDVLLSASEEVDFYRGILSQLVSQIDEDVENLLQKKPTVPSYTLYPGFLANLRNRLNDRKLIRPQISRKIGVCHFELSHISSRLEENKANLGSLDLTKPESVLAHVGNWRGLQKLATENIGRFDEATRELRLEAERLRSVVRNYELWSENNLEALIASQNVDNDGDGSA